MSEVRLYGEITGFDRVLYHSVAHWTNFTLGVVSQGKAEVEVWRDGIDSNERLQNSVDEIINTINEFILSVEWAYGYELQLEVKHITAPAFGDDKGVLAIEERLKASDSLESFVSPRVVPKNLPRIPLDSKRWIQIWLESTKLHEYVEEQLRRQFLLIEELWQELHPTLTLQQKADKKTIKLIRDFVSHSSCDNPKIVSLVEHNLPDSVEIINGCKHVRFIRNEEHRNYISKFEVKSREIARALVDRKMAQIGRVENA